MGLGSYYESESKYMSTKDFEDGEELQCVIDRAVPEEIGREREKKAVLYFRQMKKGLPLNKTNFRVLAAAFGRDEDFESADVEGKKVVVYRDVTDYGGQMVACLRIRVSKADSGGPSGVEGNPF